MAKKAVKKKTKKKIAANKAAHAATQKRIAEKIDKLNLRHTNVTNQLEGNKLVLKQINKELEELTKQIDDR